LHLLFLLESRTMKITPASYRDFSDFRRLFQKCFQRDAWPFLNIVAALTWPDLIRLKAVNKDQMVGFVIGDPRPSKGFAWIATIGVDPVFQRQGIGRALLIACEREVKQPRIKLSVRVSNNGAIALYEQEGYKMTDVWKNYYDDDEDALIMEKNI